MTHVELDPIGIDVVEVEVVDVVDCPPSVVVVELVLPGAVGPSAPPPHSAAARAPVPIRKVSAIVRDRREYIVLYSYRDPWRFGKAGGIAFVSIL
jgi:hypothetical protein